MDNGNKTTQGLAEAILDSELSEQGGLDALIQATNCVFDKLKTFLTKRLGVDGYRALLARAISVSALQLPWLRVITIAPDGSVDNLATAIGSLSLPPATNGCIAIIANFIMLLETFVGTELSLRLLGNIWPKEIAANLAASKDFSNE